MNILFVASDNNCVSGAFLSMVKLTAILQKKYNHRIIVVLPKEGPGKTLLDKEGIKSITIPSYDWTVRIANRKSLKIKIKHIIKEMVNQTAVPKICKVIREENIDLVHINTSWTYVGAKAALKMGVPLIWHIREFLEEDQKREIWNKKKGYALMKQATHAVAISQSIFEKYAPIIGKEKMTAILNGIDPEPFLCTEHRILEKPIIQLLIVGRVCERKGQLDAIRACISLHKKGYKNFRLSVVGADANEEALKMKKLVENCNASDYIKFCGTSDNVAEYYKSSDITFMCSVAEAFGRVTVEAMMSGSLVIGAESAGTVEIIKNGETGLLYAGGNVDDLEIKLRYAIEHPEEMRKVATCGQKDMLEHMTAQINADKINKLYQTVMGEQAVD